MKRLLATIKMDLRLQFRNGFYYAAAFVAVIMIVLLNQIPAGSEGLALPMVIMTNALINAFYFMAGLVLLEKGEGSLESLVVTPLRPGEYLASKAITLTILTLAENIVIVALTYGLYAQWLALIAGISLLVPFMVFVGFIAVSRYDSINEFLFPSALYVLALSLPVFSYVGLLPGRWIYLHPVQASLQLLQEAFYPVGTLKVLYGLAYAALWVVVGYYFARRSFHRFVVLKVGTRT